MKKVTFVVLMIIFLATSLPTLADGFTRDGKNKKKVKKSASVKKVVRKKPTKPSGPKSEADYARAGFKRVVPLEEPPPQILRLRVTYTVTCSENREVFLRLYLTEEFTKATTIYRRNELVDYQKVSVQTLDEFTVISKNIAKSLIDAFGVEVVILREGYFLIEKPNFNLNAKRLQDALQLTLLPFEVFEGQPPVACGIVTQVAKRQKIR